MQNYKITLIIASKLEDFFKKVIILVVYIGGITKYIGKSL